MRLSVVVACMLFASVAAAESARVRWRGVAMEGRAPPSLPQAAAAHVTVALRQLGSTVVSAGAFDAEAGATCAFPSSAKVAHCVVVVASRGGQRAERRAEVRYRDAEDLAESLALLVSEILTNDLPDVLSNPPSTAPKPIEPVPQNPPPPTPPPQPPPAPPTVEQQKAHEAEMQRQLEIVRQLQQQADEARAAREKEEAKTRAKARANGKASARPAQPSGPVETRTAVELGAVAVVGLGASNPTLVGGALRALHARGLLRVGGSLSLVGMRQTLSGYDLSFFRGLIAARAGVGVRNAIADFDLTGGPALVVLVDDAHAAGRHAVASFAVTVGPRLALTLAGPIALVIGADVDIAVTDEKVVAGTSRVAQFSRAAVEATIGIAYRPR